MKKLLLLIALVSLIVFACKKEPKVEPSNFSITNEEIVKGTTSVVITVTYSYPSVLEHVDGYISTNNDMSNANNVHATINQNTFVLRFNDLQANTHYYYQYEYSTGVDIYKTDISSFTTNDYAIPMVETAEVTSITAMSAQCGGVVIDDGGLDVTARGICWSNNTNPTIDDYHTSNGTGSGSFTSNMTDLAVSTMYYVRAYATNSKGTSYGNTKELTTTDGKPTVITNEVTDITGTSAKCGGNVTSDGGFPVTERGVCWSTNENPTINDSHTNDGTGMGFFTSNIVDLNGSTNYYIKAYAINEIGIAYGNQLTFITETPPPPTGAINGLFSVSDTQKVYFSQGNLQYMISTNTWEFAEHQYDYITHNSFTGTSLFGWGTSGYDHGAVSYAPMSTSDSYSNYYAYGNSLCNLSDQTGKADWGYNAISNGGNTENQWRTLTKDEWEYVFMIRETSSGIRFARAIVNNHNGMVLLPDNWNGDNYNINNPNGNNSYMEFHDNIISLSDWTNIFEANGAVFLPAPGYREGSVVRYTSYRGYYWSATQDNSNITRAFGISIDGYNIIGDCARWLGCSVRLVHDN